MNVHYGFAKLNKIRKKRALTVMFENCALTERGEKFMKKMMHVVCLRRQTDAEVSEGKLQNRAFTSFEYFLDEKPFLGNIEHVLENNFIADENHATVEIREDIRVKLREAYKQIYK